MIIDMEGVCVLQKVNIGASPKWNQCTYKSVEKISSTEGFFYSPRTEGDKIKIRDKNQQQ